MTLSSRPKADLKKDLDDIKSRYPAGRALALPALHMAQSEYGWLSSDALKAVADYLNMPKALLRGVATFYSRFSEMPMGRNLIQVCTNVSCMLFGAESLVDMVRRKYNVEPGRTSPDGRFSLVVAECIGACDRGPAMLVNSEFHYRLDKKNIIDILERYR